MKIDKVMKCFLCKGEVADNFATFMADTNDRIVIIKNTPAQICKQCGLVSYSDCVAAEIENIIWR